MNQVACLSEKDVKGGEEEGGKGGVERGGEGGKRGGEEGSGQSRGRGKCTRWHTMLTLLPTTQQLRTQVSKINEEGVNEFDKTGSYDGLLT